MRLAPVLMRLAHCAARSLLIFDFPLGDFRFHKVVARGGIAPPRTTGFESVASAISLSSSVRWWLELELHQ